ncbi:hypothetical protein, partial [Thiolapillus sp.]
MKTPALCRGFCVLPISHEHPPHAPPRHFPPGPAVRRRTAAPEETAAVFSKRVFGLVIDFGTSQSPKSTQPLTTYLCPSRPGHQALRN